MKENHSLKKKEAIWPIRKLDIFRIWISLGQEQRTDFISLEPVPSSHSTPSFCQFDSNTLLLYKVPAMPL